MFIRSRQAGIHFFGLLYSGLGGAWMLVWIVTQVFARAID